MGETVKIAAILARPTIHATAAPLDACSQRALAPLVGTRPAPDRPLTEGDRACYRSVIDTVRFRRRSRRRFRTRLCARCTTWRRATRRSSAPLPATTLLLMIESRLDRDYRGRVALFFGCESTGFNPRYRFSRVADAYEGLFGAATCDGVPGASGGSARGCAETQDLGGRAPLGSGLSYSTSSSTTAGGGGGAPSY